MSSSDVTFTLTLSWTSSSEKHHLLWTRAVVDKSAGSEGFLMVASCWASRRTKHVSHKSYLGPDGDWSLWSSLDPRWVQSEWSVCRQVAVHTNIAVPGQTPTDNRVASHGAAGLNFLCHLRPNVASCTICRPQYQLKAKMVTKRCRTHSCRSHWGVGKRYTCASSPTKLTRKLFLFLIGWVSLPTVYESQAECDETPYYRPSTNQWTTLNIRTSTHSQHMLVADIHQIYRHPTTRPSLNHSIDESRRTTTCFSRFVELWLA